jgi:hypothetical protein
MRRGILLIFALPMMLAALIMAAPAAFAAINFVAASASLSGVDLVVSWHESGLATNTLTSYTASADATATYVCVNNGGANPSAKNKTTVNGPVSASGTFSSGKNGTVMQSLTLTPPPPPATFSCPSGQTQETAEVTYTMVSIEDTTNMITDNISGTFSTGCLLPNVRGACS